MQGIDKFIKDMQLLSEESKKDFIKCKLITDIDLFRNVVMVRIIFDLPDGRNINIAINRDMYEEG